MEDFRFFIFMQKPERRNFHFASIIGGCSVQSTDQRPDRIDRATGFN
jgi:hypothetical protein